MKIYLFALIGATFVMVSCSKENTQNASKDTTKEVLTTKGNSEYPLNVCVVSGKKLGSMGKPYTIDHEGTTVKFCCKHCLPKFQKEPAKYLSKLKK